MISVAAIIYLFVAGLFGCALGLFLEYRWPSRPGLTEARVHELIRQHPMFTEALKALFAEEYTRDFIRDICKEQYKNADFWRLIQESNRGLIRSLCGSELLGLLTENENVRARIVYIMREEWKRPPNCACTLGRYGARVVHESCRVHRENPYEERGGFLPRMEINEVKVKPNTRSWDDFLAEHKK